jgi:2,3-bisphosphoglycerate-dependent phosphoglycerate mutase
LTPKGEAEAIAAARFIRGFDDNKVDVDVVFTSRLQRACLTATLLSDSLGINPEAIVQDWRLNEQMYGALTGLNKREAMAQFGHAQVQRWRRGWNEAPPAVLTGPEWTFKAEPKCSGLKENCDIDEQEWVYIVLAL